MSSHEDLSSWPGLPGSKQLLAVGFLDPRETCFTGTVSRAFFESLTLLLVDPWQPFVNAGRHPCPFCRFTGGPAAVSFDGHDCSVGTSLLFVPGTTAAYVAPSLIAHYIDAHGYAPPEEFQRAVLHCPRMKSAAYRRALREFGIR